MYRDQEGRFVKGHGIKPVWLYTEEVRQKLSIISKVNPARYWKGKKLSQEHKLKMSLAKIGRSSNRLGIKLSKVSKHRMRLAKLGKMGKLANNYKHGLSGINKREWGTDEFKQWRKKVFERDNYTCCRCLMVGRLLHAHHMKSFKEYLKLRYLPINGITLCNPCHKLFHKVYGYKGFSLKDSLEFINYFKGL